jgi:glycosyltransferase 2 family protein
VKLRPDLKFLGKLALSIAALVLLLHQIDLHIVVQNLRSVRIDLVPAVLGLVLGQFMLSGWRWRYILHRMNAPEPGLCALLHCTGQSYFYGQLLPSSIGGDVLRTALVARTVGLQRTTLSVLIDRLSGLFVLTAWAAVALPVVSQEIGVRWPTVVAIGAALAFGGMATIAIFWAGMRSRGLFACLLSLLRNAWTDAARVVARPAIVGVLFATSAAMHLASIGLFYAIARGLGLPVGLGHCLLLLPPALLLSGLPISLAGWGVREGAVVAALSVVGIAPGDALTASILYGLTTPVLGVATVAVGFVGRRFDPIARGHILGSAAEIGDD